MPPQDEERRRAEELIWKHTPVILPGDEHDNNYNNHRVYEEDVPNGEEKGPSQPMTSTATETMFPPQRLSAYISCNEGLEQFMHNELNDLGIAHQMHKTYGALLLEPTVEDLMICHLYLGTASNIFLRCGDTFSARALGELQRKVMMMPWANILGVCDRNSPPKFKVKVSSAKSRLLHTSAVRDQMLSGIYESLGFSKIAETLKDHTKPKEEKDRMMGVDANKDDDSDGDSKVVRLAIHFFRDRAQISIDTSATPLHKRAYRLETGKAPLREDLAFAFLLSAGWRPSYIGFNKRDRDPPDSNKQKSPVKTPPSAQYTSFLDPFCGSGTLPIEAAAMAAGLPPGRLRPAPLAGTVLYDPEGWNRLVQEGLQRSTPIDNSFSIFASDRDKGAVQATQSNAERAGVSGFIDTRVCSFSDHQWLERPAIAPDNLLVAANLPWGKRLKVPAHKRNDQKRNALLPMYQRIATQCNAFTALGKKADAIFLTDFPAAFETVNFRAKFATTLSTRHGGISCEGVKVNLGQAKQSEGNTGNADVKKTESEAESEKDQTHVPVTSKIDAEQEKDLLVL